ncbi:hypothetical protein C0J52_08026 [Blattella germanica]|nr:hypothetical protein C0J52_08026 [Blattella germanica]
MVILKYESSPPHTTFQDLYTVLNYALYEICYIPELLTEFEVPSCKTAILLILRSCFFIKLPILPGLASSKAGTLPLSQHRKQKHVVRCYSTWVDKSTSLP